MTSGNRTALFAKVHKVLKKHYKPVAIDAQRKVLDHLLFACLLENALYEDAEAAFAALVHTFFDWNEIRVTSIAELSEVMAMLPDPRAASYRLKRVLHAVFEASYSFDLEDKRKKNLGPTVKWFEKLDGCSPFGVAYVVQAALGGHAIAIDSGSMTILRLLDLVSEKDAQTGNVPGMERAIAKSKGVEFASLLHQFGADYTINPYSPKIREILTEIEPASVANLPKRRAPKAEKAPEAPAQPAEAKPAAKPAKGEKPAAKHAAIEPPKKGAKPEKHEKGAKPGVEKSPAEKAHEKAAEKPVKPEKAEKPAEKTPAKAAPAKPAAEKGVKSALFEAAGKLPKKKPEPAKPAPAAKAPAPSKPAPPKTPPEKPAAKPSAAEKPAEPKPAPKGEADKKKSPAAKLAKKKPR